MSRHLMARFRHLAANEHGLSFDWRAHPRFSDHYLANLENGDWLSVGPELPGPNQDQSWSYGIYGPLPGHLDKHNLPAYDYEKGHFVQYGPDDDPPPPGYKTGDEDWVLGSAPARFRRRGWPYHGASSPQEAMRNAEQHYHTLNRRSVAPAPENYDINDIMRRFDNGEL